MKYRIWMIAILLLVNLLEAKPTVTVVGAGLAGLTAAYRLQKMGYPVEVYEARNRPGGRVLTAYFGLSHEELGGKNLNDGGDATHILALMNELGLDTEEQSCSQDSHVLINGRTLSWESLFRGAPAPTEEAYAALHSRQETARSLGELIDHFIGDGGDLRYVIEGWVNGYEGIPSHLMAPELLHTVFWRIYTFTWELAQAFGRGEIHMHTQRTVAGGNSRLVEELAKALDGHIHYHHVLKQVERTSDEHFSLGFEDQEPVTADYVILTIPCTLLRTIEFEKDLLPEDQQKAIATLPYGMGAKMLVPVQAKPDVTHPFSLVDRLSVWFNRDQSVMTLYCCDRNGIFNSDSLPVLTKLIQTQIASLPLYYRNLTFTHGLIPTIVGDAFKPQFKQPVGISWTHEPFSRGSYSTYGIGQYALFHELIEEEGVVMRKVFRPIDGHLLFAGEHTAVNEYATMEGAVESGDTVAMYMQGVKPGQPR